MDKCPYCGAETRQGDNFCLNCGNRLLPATPSPSSGQQAQPAVGEATVAATDDWNSAAPGSAPASGQSWGGADFAAPTAFGSPSEPATVREPSGTAQATMDRISEPGVFILRSDNGDVIQEYPLDKTEIVIGRAPTSDILLSKDKLTSRRHATVRYENNQYLLHDEHSANGTFVNGQQLEEATPYALQDGDQVGIGEHELLFRAHGAQANEVEDQPTIAEPQNASANPDFTYRTRNDDHGTISENDDYGTAAMDNSEAAYDAPAAETAHVEPPATPAPEENAPISQYEPVPAPAPVQEEEPAAPMAAHDVEESVPAAPASIEKTPYAVPSSPAPAADSHVSFSRFSALSSPSLPDISALMAALSSLDGQIMSLQEQFNATQDAMRDHDAEVTQTASQLRSGIRRVSDRMDGMIADVARSREALAWAELLQLMEDVMNNPRDIEYVTKLARKARELNKVFQIHQNVLNTMAECNSLLRSLIGEEK